MHQQIAQVIGVAVMQLLVEKQEPSIEALIEMIQCCGRKTMSIWLWN